MTNSEPDTTMNTDGPSVTSVPVLRNDRSALDAQDTAAVSCVAAIVAEAEAAHRAAVETLAMVGRKPPTPATARGLLGEKVLEVIRPLFAWYTHGLRQYLDHLEARGALFLRALAAVSSDVQARALESNAILQNQQGDIAKLSGAISDLTALLQRFESRLDSAVRQSSVDSRTGRDLNAAVINLTARVRALEEQATKKSLDETSLKERWARLEEEQQKALQAQQSQSTEVERQQRENNATVARISASLVRLEDRLHTSVKAQERLHTESAHRAAAEVEHLSAEIRRMDARVEELTAILFPLSAVTQELSAGQEELSGRLSTFVDSASEEVATRVEATIVPAVQPTRNQVAALAESIEQLRATKTAKFPSIYKKG